MKRSITYDRKSIIGSTNRFLKTDQSIMIEDWFLIRIANFDKRQTSSNISLPPILSNIFVRLFSANNSLPFFLRRGMPNCQKWYLHLQWRITSFTIEHSPLFSHSVTTRNIPPMTFILIGSLPLARRAVENYFMNVLHRYFKNIRLNVCGISDESAPMVTSN